MFRAIEIRASIMTAVAPSNEHADGGQYDHHPARDSEEHLVTNEPADQQEDTGGGPNPGAERAMEEMPHQGPFPCWMISAYSAGPNTADVWLAISRKEFTLIGSEQLDAGLYFGSAESGL
jgi:hypothetical protein